jgi:hypothetical protein
MIQQNLQLTLRDADVQDGVAKSVASSMLSI